MKRFEFLEKEAIADYAIIAEGDTLEEAFEASAEAIFSLMINDLSKVNCINHISVEEEAEDLELLLFKFLNDLIYLKDKDRLVFSKFNISIQGNKLNCDCCGQVISENLEQNIDVKSVTMHNLSIKQNGKWIIHFVVDV